LRKHPTRQTGERNKAADGRFVYWQPLKDEYAELVTALYPTQYVHRGISGCSPRLKQPLLSGSSWCRSGRAVNVRLADLIAQQQKRIIQWLRHLGEQFKSGER
jgi:hypothetical protein